MKIISILMKLITREAGQWMKIGLLAITSQLTLESGCCILQIELTLQLHRHP
jgi:hypothetical protein